MCIQCLSRKNLRLVTQTTASLLSESAICMTKASSLVLLTDGHVFYVEAYVPPLSRGRLDYTKYQEYEDAINLVIANAIGNDDGEFSIQEQSVLSMDTNENSNADNQFFLFVKSFIVVINK